MSLGIVLCSRADSSRVTNKPFIKIEGKPIIQRLIERLLPLDITICLAVPEEDSEKYQFLRSLNPKRVLIYTGQKDDPLQRMKVAAKMCGFETIIRITHDKILVDTDAILPAVGHFMRTNADYLHLTNCHDGTGFEVMSLGALEKAADKYKNVEHVSYALKSITSNVVTFDAKHNHVGAMRFLIDYPQDVEFFETLFSIYTPDTSLKDYVEEIYLHSWLAKINELPKLTVYTCAYNEEKYVQRAIGSVSKQKDFKDFEYIVVDDCSNDDTAYLTSKFCNSYYNSKWVRNQANVGLAASSNIAIKHARGKYIIRLDADDWLVQNDILVQMLHEIKSRNLDALYPNNYFGELKTIQSGKDAHHCGGTMFKTSALNHLKFTDELRGHEGLDLFVRAKDVLTIGYWNMPAFFYTQRHDSMSKTNPKDRDTIRERILAQA